MPPPLYLSSTRRHAVDYRRCCATLCDLVAPLRYALLVRRALNLVLPDGRDVGRACCCCAGSFAPATPKGRWYGIIARCLCAPACRIRMAVGGLAGLCALRASAAPSTSTAPPWVYLTSGWGHAPRGGVCCERAAAGVGIRGGCAAVGQCAIASCCACWSALSEVVEPCLGMCLHPPLAGRESMPGLTTSAWRRVICRLIIAGTISSTVSAEYRSAMANSAESCSLLAAPWRARMATAAADDAKSVDWARLPLHLPISFVSCLGSPPARDTQTRSCLPLWPVFSIATSLGSAHGDSCASARRDACAR